MKIQQMAFMLVAVFIFFIMIGMFLLVFQVSRVQEEAALIGQEEARSLVARIANSPEFSCGEAYDGVLDCLDMDKLLAVSQNEAYRGFWDVAEIRVLQLYPNGTQRACDATTYPDCNELLVYSQNVPRGAAIANYASLCRKASVASTIIDSCSFGQIIISPEEEREG